MAVQGNDNGQDQKITLSELTKFWTDLGQNASAYAGARAVYKDLKRKGDTHTTYKDVVRLLAKIPSYSQHLRMQRLIRHRNVGLDVGVGEGLQADVAYMPETRQGFHKILIAVDPFDNFIYAEPMKGVAGEDTLRAFKKMFRKHSLDNVKYLATDAGGEFVGLRDWYKQKKIIFHIMTNKHKAFQAERAIRTVKGRLYRSLRHEFSTDWTALLQDVVTAINFSPSRGIGNLTPMLVNDPVFDPDIARARQETREKNEKFLPSLKQREFKVKDFVYRDPLTSEQSPFYKGYDFARGPIYQIWDKDITVQPYIYRLKDLKGAKQRGFFYGAQLRMAPNPDTVTFPIEKVLDKRVDARGNKEIKV